MENSKHELQSLIKLKKLRRTLQVLALISLSIVSLLFSDLSWLPSSLTSIDIFLSSFVSGFLQAYMNKTVIFLLCNGILFIVSGFPGFVISSNNSLHDEVPHVQSETRFQEPKVLAPQKETTEETAWPVVIFSAEEEGENLEMGKELQIIIEYKQEDKDEDEEEEEKEEILNFEESDARFEDFIRRMKEGMRIEERQLVIMM
ncbi:uncharacterized protein [Aristolochia californica]|uniref:uncharacterized protein n=1 Tax=Aristolochia californica TaxID=171875 RepID=UPI0035E0352D